MRRIAAIIPVLVCLAFSIASAQQYKEDYNGDGNLNIADMIALLLLGRDNPTDPRADYNGDGEYAIDDAIALIMAIRDGILTPDVEKEVIQGITMVSIPAGTFQMGTNRTDYSWFESSRPVHSVTLSPFQMAQTAITYSQYAEYLNAALAAGEITAETWAVRGATGDYSGQLYIYLQGDSGPNNKCWISYNGTSFSVETGKENKPVVYVTWYGAKAFALKYSMDLPTEAQWEYACRGGQQYEYGTDDGTISNAKANYDMNVGQPKPVGSYPANPFGLYDMAGNVWEWCNDWYDSNYYSSSPNQDPSGPETGSMRAGRGGAWNRDAYVSHSAFRSADEPGALDDHSGFRVVLRVSFLQN